MAVKHCVLDENKICDDCGECNRCDLDPNKICDNCCRCIAMENEGREFRSITVSKDGAKLEAPKFPLSKKRESIIPQKNTDDEIDRSDEPVELTPELVDYWEKILLQYGEAPADDGFGEIDVSVKNPVYGKRPAGERRGKRR